jgi:RNA-directed DNA polymerase
MPRPSPSRFGLSLHPDKTRFIDFRPARPGGTPADGKHDPEKLQTFRTRSCARFKAPSFDFLGFTHTWMKSQNGKNVVRQRTAKSRLTRALVAVNDWCRKNRHQPIPDQQAKLSAKLIGHYAYYGITGNIEHLGRYFKQVTRAWKKWLERRTRGQPLTWAVFGVLLQRHPLPRPRIVRRYVAASKALP